ncbi:hypothetical protein AVEN_34993-1 [Araneus ventricosus]|uniref:Uncharacterized protein n=1 Tax=Araneus ventricosus TaxID=182803 RepID=A0A4Y2DGA7_ARAVE|nr:hypothetical protein AVEN_34993-1 [Araneus ventricosus]
MKTHLNPWIGHLILTNQNSMNILILTPSEIGKSVLGSPQASSSHHVSPAHDDSPDVEDDARDKLAAVRGFFDSFSEN